MTANSSCNTYGYNGRVNWSAASSGTTGYDVFRDGYWIASTDASVRNSTEADATLRTVNSADILVILGEDAKVDTSATLTP